MNRQKATEAAKTAHSAPQDAAAVLEDLTRQNGRYLIRKQPTRAGVPIYGTADLFSGCDYYEGTAEEVLNWERGYITAIRAEKGKK